MDISVNTLWTNSYHYVKGKLTDGLSPLEKKIAIVVAAYFVVAAIGYALFRCFCQKQIVHEPRPAKPVKPLPW